MKSSRALRVLAELSSSQWGMVTTAQAAAHGVTRLDLSRLAQAGHIERLVRGVYRDAGAPADEFESLRAAWLATDPSLSADERLRDLAGGVVVMGASAASLHGAGDLPADRHEFSAPIRRQSQRPEISYWQRKLDPSDVTIVHGLPATKVEQTVADLVEARTDLSLVADVLRDAARTRRLDTGRLTELLGPLAARNGLGRDEGAALLDRLATLAGLDASSLADAIAESETLTDLVTATRLEQLSYASIAEGAVGPAAEKAFRTLRKSVAQSMEQSMASALDVLSASTDSPAFTELRTNLSKVAEQAALSIPVEDFFRSFGQEWAARLAPTGADPRADLLPGIEFAQATSERS